jgi:single-stranded DNA-specific DHH superfamily exonuclease
MNSQKLIKYLENIKKSDKIYIYYHNDGDGVISALAMIKVLTKYISIENIKSSPTLKADSKINQEVSKNKPDKLIFLDISDTTGINYKNILQIDHHPSGKYTKGITITPEDGNVACCYLIYTIIKNTKILDIKEIDEIKWIIGLGLLSDLLFTKESIKFLEEIKKEYKIFSDIVIKDEKISRQKISFWRKLLPINPYKSSYLVRYINSPFETEKESLMLNILLNCKDPRKIYESKDGKLIKKMYDKREYEIKRVCKDFERNFKKKKKYSEFEMNDELKVAFYFPDTALTTNSYINALSFNHPEWYVFCFSNLNEKEIRISVRNQESKVDLGKLLGSLIKGGGHPNAAGGVVSKENLDKFKVDFLNSLKNMENK